MTANSALRVASAALLSGLAAGCIPTIEDDVSVVTKPRILAVQASPAEAAPAAAVKLSALVASPNDDDAIEPVEWELCLARKPLTELGPVNPACLVRGPNGGDDSAAGRGDGVKTTVPSDACTLFGPTPPPPQGDDPGGRPVDPDPTGGYYQPFVGFLGSDDKALGAIRVACGLNGGPPEARIGYVEQYRPNENPEIDSLDLVRGRKTIALAPFDAATSNDVVVSRGESVTLQAHWVECPRKSVCGDGICGGGEDVTSCADDCTTPRGCTGAETYAWYDAVAQKVVERREGIAISWYATEGEFDERRTGIAGADPDVAKVGTHWTAPGGAGSVRLWAVVRDDRGGVSWKAYRIQVEE